MKYLSQKYLERAEKRATYSPKKPVHQPDSAGTKDIEQGDGTP